MRDQLNGIENPLLCGGDFVRPLTATDHPKLLELLDKHPILAVFIRGHLDERPNFFSTTSGPRLIGRFERSNGPNPPADSTEYQNQNQAQGQGKDQDRELVDVCWLGANAVPLGALDSGELWAKHANQIGHRFVSIFGPQASVMAMWQHYQSTKKPFAVRENQPLLALSKPPAHLDSHPDVRLATRADLPALFPAAVEMFTEEVGYSPLVSGSNSYRDRLTDRIDRGYSYILTAPQSQGAGAGPSNTGTGPSSTGAGPNNSGAGPNNTGTGPQKTGTAPTEVIFKAELGNVGGNVAQINGVWVAPQYRGAGLAKRCLTAVVRHALTNVNEVSLYVNSYNEPATRLYRDLGFERVGTFATVLL